MARFILAIISSLLIQVAKADQTASGLLISKRTTWFLGPLDKSGEIDYLRAIREYYGKNVEPKENAAVELWQAIGPRAVPANWRTSFFQILGMQPPDEDTSFTRLEAFAESLNIDKSSLIDSLNISLGREWRATDHPHLAQWVETNSKAFEHAIMASRMPRLFTPMLLAPEIGQHPIPIMNCLFPLIQETRSVAHGLICRSMLRASQGRLEDAWADIMAVFRLSSLMAQHHVPIGGVAGSALASRAFEAANNLIMKTPPTILEQQLVAIQNLPQVIEPSDRINGQNRGMLLSIVSHVAIHKGRGMQDLAQTDGDSDWITQLALEHIDWDEVLWMVNRFYDKLSSETRYPLDATRRKQLILTTNEMLAKHARIKRRDFGDVDLEDLAGFYTSMVGEILISYMAEAWIDPIVADHRRRARIDITHMAIALQIYKFRQGDYPEALDALVPDLVPELPVSIFGDQSITYTYIKEGVLILSDAGDHLQYQLLKPDQQRLPVLKFERTYIKPKPAKESQTWIIVSSLSCVGVIGAVAAYARHRRIGSRTPVSDVTRTTPGSQ